MSEQAAFIPFTKMHGAGNDYVVLDGIRDALPRDLAAFAVRTDRKSTRLNSSH